MADEYIRKADAVSIAESYEVKRDGFHLNDYEYGRNQVADSIASDLEDMPPADVVPVVHAYWEGEETDCNIKCHKCGKAFRDYIITQDYADLSEYPNFCPNCGAIMDVKEKG